MQDNLLGRGIVITSPTSVFQGRRGVIKQVLTKENNKTSFIIQLQGTNTILQFQGAEFKGIENETFHNY